MKKHWRLIWWTALFLGWIFDRLFWQKDTIALWALYVWLLIGATVWVMRRLDVAAAPYADLVLVVTGVFSTVVAVRQEPLAVTLSVLSGWLLFSLAATAYTKGDWTRWRFMDYLYNELALIVDWLGEPISYYQRMQREDADSGKKLFWPILRGILIALPIVLFFTLILSTADPIFAEKAKQFLAIFRLENWPELLFRLFYILVIAYSLSGFWLHAAFKSQQTRVSADESTLIKPFVGMIESGIVLGSVMALFASFLLIQFRYFFGGQANIHIDGFTYAEYVHRGFGELVTVAIFSLALLMLFQAITRRTDKISEKIFIWMAVGMVAEVLVILLSAYQRMLLYEQAYGYTRLRLYVQVFMIWLGLLLMAFAALLWLRQTKRFAFLFLIFSLGFVAVMAAVNVDGVVARQNIRRAAQGSELDSSYLLRLSLDAFPSAAQAYQNADLSPALREEIGGVLTCWSESDRLDDWHLASWRAKRWLARLDLSAYELEEGAVNLPSGDILPCHGFAGAGF